MDIAQHFMKRAINQVTNRHEILAEIEGRLAKLEEEFISLVGKPKSATKKLEVTTELVQLLKTSALILDLSESILCGICYERTVVKVSETERKCFRCNPDKLIEEATRS